MRLLACLSLAAVAACQMDASGEAAGAYEETSPSLWCGTQEPSENVRLSTEAEVARMPRREAVEGGAIDVYVHIINKGARAADGNVSDEAIAAQMAVLNAAFADRQWRFQLIATDRVTQPTWFPLRAGSREELTAKALLRKGTARALNIYVTDPGAGMLGYATFPTDYKKAPDRDGVVILHSTLPGGSAAPFNLGDQLVHQVGHWMGLYHTFAADCSTDRGDFVNDTPPTSMPAFGCPVGRDTCGASGDDPVRNYMDSTDDGCMNAFTDGQARRIQTQFDAFRRFD